MNAVLNPPPYDEMDEPVVRLCKALNALPGIRTIGSCGGHHEIYLGDPRRAAPERLRTLLRQPVE